MKTSPRKTRILWMVALTAAVLVGGTWTWRAVQIRATVVAALPERPAADGLPGELAARLIAAEERARSLRSSVAGLAELARLHHANGHLPQATTCERALILLQPDVALWPYLLAHTTGGYGDLDEAEPLLERAIALAPDYVPARIRLGEILLKRNQPLRAAELFAHVLSRFPTDGYAAMGHARAEVALGRVAAARARLQQLVAQQPQFTPAWTLLVNLDEQLGDTAAAEEHRTQALASGRPREMPDPWVDELMVDCYDPYRLAVAASAADPADNQARARELLERAVVVAPRDDMPHRLLGNLLSDLGDLRRARHHLERATELDPREPDNWSHLVRVLKAMNDVAAAGRSLEAGLQQCPEAPALHLERGRRWLAMGELDRAAEAFERTRQLRPEESSAYVELAGVRFKQNRLEEGVAYLREAVKVDPSHPVAVVLLARYAISTGHAEEARQWIKRSRLQRKVSARDLNLVIEEYRGVFGQNPD